MSIAKKSMVTLAAALITTGLLAPGIASAQWEYTKQDDTGRAVATQTLTMYDLVLLMLGPALLD